MSSLMPERSIVISPSLAATIGLEEAVLLQVLHDLSAFTQNEHQQGYDWVTIERQQLLTLLPFWDQRELQRVSKNLKDKGILLVDSPPLTQSKQFRFAINEQTKNSSPLAVQAQQPHTQRRQQSSQQQGAGLLAENWQPDEDLLQLLTLSHSIPREFSLQQREDFVLYWRDRQQVSHSWSTKFRQHVLKEWRFQQSRAASTATTIPSKDINTEWQPSPEALEILHRTGISADFIEDAVPEFVLYWRERGEAHSTWNSKFIAHIRRQWAQFTKALELDYEPREIAANWQPSEDVYDILRLANIDVEFARKLVPEFVLFWRDTQQIQRSWNTKFLQHAKYQWATRHHMPTYDSGKHHAGQSVSHQSTGTTNELKQSPFKQLTDRSWAEGIVNDL